MPEPLHFRLARQCVWWLLALLLLALLNFDVVLLLPVTISRDTLLHLSAFGIFCLLLLVAITSTTLVLFCLTKSRWLQCRYLPPDAMTRSRSIVLVIFDGLLTLALIWTALSLAPQVFYTLYRVIIPGLPAQWVAGLLSLQELTPLLRINSESSLAQLATGVLVQSTLLATAIAWIDFGWRSKRITKEAV